MLSMPSMCAGVQGALTDPNWAALAARLAPIPTAQQAAWLLHAHDNRQLPQEPSSGKSSKSALTLMHLQAHVRAGACQPLGLRPHLRTLYFLVDDQLVSVAWTLKGLLLLFDAD